MVQPSMPALKPCPTPPALRHRPAWLAAALLLALAGPADAARLALVVGNDSYKNITPLQNSRNDAQALARELEAAGFKVSRALDASRESLYQQIDLFLGRIEKGDEVVFFFSGHGTQPPQMGPFLLPVDIKLTSERSVWRDGVSLEQLIEDLNRRARFSLIIVDACRDDPFRETVAGRSLPRGSSLGRVEPPKGTVVIMAASRGQQALDRLSDRDPVPNGLFTRELIKYIRQRGISVADMLKQVRTSVETIAASVQHQQRPALVDESSSEFFFYPGAAQAAAAPPPPPSPPVQQPVTLAPAPPPPAPVIPVPEGPQREFEAWERASRLDTREALSAFAAQFPDGRYALFARQRLAALGGTGGTGAPAAPAPAPPADPAAASLQAEFELWDKAASSRRRADYEAYLRRYPNGRYADHARAALAAPP